VLLLVVYHCLHGIDSYALMYVYRPCHSLCFVCIYTIYSINVLCDMTQFNGHTHSGSSWGHNILIS
jgi:hypothetical protein